MSTCVDKGVGVLLEEQVLQHATLGHEPEEVVITAKEHMQPAGKTAHALSTCQTHAVSLGGLNVCPLQNDSQAESK